MRRRVGTLMLAALLGAAGAAAAQDGAQAVCRGTTLGTTACPVGVGRPRRDRRTSSRGAGSMRCA